MGRFPRPQKLLPVHRAQFGCGALYKRLNWRVIHTDHYDGIAVTVMQASLQPVPEITGLRAGLVNWAKVRRMCRLSSPVRCRSTSTAPAHLRAAAAAGHHRRAPCPSSRVPAVARRPRAPAAHCAECELPPGHASRTRAMPRIPGLAVRVPDGAAMSRTAPHSASAVPVLPAPAVGGDASVSGPVAATLRPARWTPRAWIQFEPRRPLPPVTRSVHDGTGPSDGHGLGRTPPQSALYRRSAQLSALNMERPPAYAIATSPRPAEGSAC